MTLKQMEDMYGGCPVSRAKGWDTKKKKIWPAEELAHDQLTLMPDGAGFINVSGDSTRLSKVCPHIIPLHYTGRRDVDSVEIYQGDVLKRVEVDAHAVGAVIVPDGVRPRIVVQWHHASSMFAMPANTSVNWRNIGSVFEVEGQDDGTDS